MILVADASALVALSAFDSLTLLEALFGQVWVPEAVFNEIAVADKPQAARLHHYLQNKVRAADMQHFVFFWMLLPMRARRRPCCFTKRWLPTIC